MVSFKRIFVIVIIKHKYYITKLSLSKLLTKLKQKSYKTLQNEFYVKMKLEELSCYRNQETCTCDQGIIVPKKNYMTVANSPFTIVQPLDGSHPFLRLIWSKRQHSFFTIWRNHKADYEDSKYYKYMILCLIQRAKYQTTHKTFIHHHSRTFLTSIIIDRSLALVLGFNCFEMNHQLCMTENISGTLFTHIFDYVIIYISGFDLFDHVFFLFVRFHSIIVLHLNLC